MSNDTSSRGPSGSGPARPAGAESLQQPVRGEPVERLPAGETAPAARYQHYPEPAPREPAYADPAYREPASPEFAAPVSRTRTATVSSPGRIGFGLGVLVLGVLLGLTDQQADGSGMALRIPALVAALIMVAQGIQLVLRGLPRETEVEVVEIVDETDPAHPHTAVRPRPWEAGMTAFRTDPGSMGLPAIVIVLAVWLGLADLRITDAPELFSNVSMLSAFVLFALGWTLIPARSEL